MVSKSSWKTYLVIGLAVALFVASGSLLTASNFGFKINTSLQNGFAAPGPKGDNWRAIPWTSPYTTYTNLCTAFVGATKANVSVATVAAATGTTTSVLCAVGSATAVPATTGIRIRITGAVAPASPNQVVFVGSSNEATALPTIVGGFQAPGPKADNWVSVVYHTQWTKASDVCATFGLGAAQGNVSRIESTTGVTTTFTCGLAANNFNLVIGEAVRVRKTTAGSGPAGVLPPHF